jgi:hypothetical protein
VVIVHHLPRIIGPDVIPYLNKARKFAILERAEKDFLDFHIGNREYIKRFSTLTLENAFPKHFTNGETYMQQ